jgi:hypothetical protein
MPIPAQALKDDVLVRYEHPQLLSKKEVSRPPVFSKNSDRTQRTPQRLERAASTVLPPLPDGQRAVSVR